MNLVQKLPIGLGLACIMLLSSCSKEEVVAPQPQAEGVNESSGLRVNDALGVVPIFPSTYGAVGIATYPVGWSRASWSNADLQQLPTGTSSLTHLWGSNILPWAKPLPQIPGIQNMNSVVTFTSKKITQSDWTSHYSPVAAKLRNLKVGQKYSVTLYLASTIRNLVPSPFVPAYAESIAISAPQQGGSFTSYVYFNGRNAEWVKKTVEFKASHSEEIITVHAFCKNIGEYAYGHVFVDSNSIKQVN